MLRPGRRARRENKTTQHHNRSCSFGGRSEALWILVRRLAPLRCALPSFVFLVSVAAAPLAIRREPPQSADPALKRRSGQRCVKKHMSASKIQPQKEKDNLNIDASEKRQNKNTHRTQKQPHTQQGHTASKPTNTYSAGPGGDRERERERERERGERQRERERERERQLDRERER